MPLVSFSPHDASSFPKTLDTRLVERNFAAITGSEMPRVESSKYNQPRDNMNILERYNNRTLDMDTEMFTAEVMNERAADLLSIFAPIVPMTEHHVSFQTREYFMLPFDIAAIGGVPRRTYWHQDARTAHLFHYNRYQAMELNYLMDVHFGRQMLNDTLGVLVAQARLTLFFQFSVAIVASAITQSYKRFANDSRSALQIHYELSYFALPHSNPDDFALKMLQLREPQTPFNALLTAENTGPRYSEIARESRSVNGYHYGYNEETGKFVVALFESRTGVAAIKGVGGDGMVILENPAYRYQNIKDERTAPTQTLQGVSNLCEVVLQPPIGADDDYTGLPGHNDPVVHDQTGTSIAHNPLSFANALSACGLWNNRDGKTPAPHQPRGFAKPFIGAGDIMTELAAEYETNGAFASWLQGKTFGNNTPDSKSYDSQTDLKDVDFRRFFPFFTLRQDAAALLKVVPAQCIFDLPERAVPMRYLEKVARFIYSKYSQEKAATIDAAYAPANQKIVAFAQSFFPDGGRTRPQRGAVNDQAARTYGVRAQPGSDDAMLGHLPLASHATYLKSLEAIQNEAARATTDEDRQAIESGKQAIFAALRQGSGTTTAVSVLNDVASALEQGKSTASFAASKLITSRMKSSESKIPASAMGASDDAMDIDGESFGAHNYVAQAVDGDDAPYLIRIERMRQADAISGNDAYKLILQEVGKSVFSLGNVENLARRYGIQLFRMNYWRPFQRYNMLHMVACIRGPSTMITGFASPIVHPSMQGMEGYINIVAQFFSAAIVTQPRNIRLIPNVFANGLINDINTSFVRSRDDMRSQSPHKPSTIPSPVPMDESIYQFPMHMFNHDTYHIRDRMNRSPTSKHSGADHIRVRMGSDLANNAVASSQSPDPLRAMPISIVAHRSWCLHHDLGTGRYVQIPGTSPRAYGKHNGTQAAAVWAGDAVRFADQPQFTVAVA